MKTCSACLRTLPADGFHRDSRTADGRRNQCKECRCAATKAWYDDTKPERTRRRIESFQANPERRRAWDRDRYRRDREKRVALAAESVKRRRERMLAGEYDRTLNRDSLRERDGDNCFYCDKLLSFETVGWGEHPADQATVEHLVRISEGGAHTFDNAVLACWPCNISRGTRGWQAWRDEVRYVGA